MTKIPHALARAIAIVTTGIAAFTLSGCAFLSTITSDDSTPVHDGSTDVFTLRVGDCINDPADGEETFEVSGVTSADCAEPHDAEVYSSIMLEGIPFPGDDKIMTATEGCADDFAKFTGIPYADAPLLDYMTFYPSAASWLTGDREILCMICQIDADFAIVPTTGTLAAAKL